MGEEFLWGYVKLKRDEEPKFIDLFYYSLLRLLTRRRKNERLGCKARLFACRIFYVLKSFP